MPTPRSVLNLHCGRFRPIVGGYIEGMSEEELADLIADVELTLVDTVDRLQQAQAGRLYVAVLELEGRMHALHDALALVADQLAGEGAAPPH